MLSIYKPIQSEELGKKGARIVDPKVITYEKFKKDSLNQANFTRMKTMEVFAFRTEEKYDKKVKGCLAIIRQNQQHNSCNIVDLWSEKDLHQMAEDANYMSDRRKILRYDYMTSLTAAQRAHVEQKATSKSQKSRNKI